MLFNFQGASAHHKLSLVLRALLLYPKQSKMSRPFVKKSQKIMYRIYNGLFLGKKGQKNAAPKRGGRAKHLYNAKIAIKNARAVRI